MTGRVVRRMTVLLSVKMASALGWQSWFIVLSSTKIPAPRRPFLKGVTRDVVELEVVVVEVVEEVEEVEDPGGCEVREMPTALRTRRPAIALMASSEMSESTRSREPSIFERAST